MSINSKSIFASIFCQEEQWHISGASERYLNG
jgi:hypothetical protein